MSRHPTGNAPSRRAFAAGLASGAVLAAARVFGAPAAVPAQLRIDDTGPGRPISRFIYGSNEIGRVDGGVRSADFDRSAGVTARRLGGNLLTTYNWVNNACNAGKDWRHENGAFLLGMLEVRKPDWTRPAAVIEAMLANSQALGAISLVTLPLAGYVAADFRGVVPQTQAAPSTRFTPVVWSGHPRPDAPIDPGVADIPLLLARLVAKYGSAASGGVWGYALDNEPGLWPQTHPRVVPTPPTIKSLIARSLAAAKAIKAADPSVKVFGPVSWGATGMVNFQNAPDWPDYQHFGSFLGAYLDAFRRESERSGQRLLDVLDVHWYAFSRLGDLLATENPLLATALLDAPRSLTEPGFLEDSWVAEALPLGPGEGVRLPLLPSLAEIVGHYDPGVELAVTEFNYGGKGQLAAGLALADALGRFGQSGVIFAAHWGSLQGWLGEAYRLFRTPDSAKEPFGGQSLPIEGATADLGVYAARSPSDRLQIIVINKAEQPAAVNIACKSGRALRLVETLGFDAAHPQGGVIAESAAPLLAPGRSARRYVFAIA